MRPKAESNPAPGTVYVEISAGRGGNTITKRRILFLRKR